MKELDYKRCYKIAQSKDPRFDGEFFIAVKTTGIYCRSVCKVPVPKEENCEFYHSAPEAEEHGFRPCLRCRPELAPNYSEFSQRDELLKEIMDCFEKNNYVKGSIAEAADYVGITTRHLNRLFHDKLGVAPKDYIMTKRLHRAKALLADTNLSVGLIGELAGFGSTSRFNAALKEHYHLTPSAIRKSKKRKDDVITVKLAYRPPYDWEVMLNFLKNRAIPGVEKVSEDGQYVRALRIMDKGQEYKGWISVKPIKDYKVEVNMSTSLEKQVLVVCALVRKVFDLDADPKQLPEIIDKGVRLPGCFNIFEMATRAILGQQITVKAATTLAGRIATNCGIPVETPFEEVNRLFPNEEEISSFNNIEDVLGELGVIRSRSYTIGVLAKEMVNGELNFNHVKELDVLKKNLLSIKGIGPWSCEYILMRAISYPDAFPVSDLGVKQGLMPYLIDEDGNKLSLMEEKYSKYVMNKQYEIAAKKFASQYRPWRSYLCIGIWNRLIHWEGIV